MRGTREYHRKRGIQWAAEYIRQITEGVQAAKTPGLDPLVNRLAWCLSNSADGDEGSAIAQAGYVEGLGYWIAHAVRGVKLSHEDLYRYSKQVCGE